MANIDKVLFTSLVNIDRISGVLKANIGKVLSASTAPVFFQAVRLDFGDGTWNTPAVATWNQWCYDEANSKGSFLNTGGTTTTVGITRNDVMVGNNEGVLPNSSGWPDDVVFWSSCCATPRTFNFTGLTNGHSYTIEFYSCTTRTFESNNTTTFTLSGNTITFAPYLYDAAVKSFTNVSPVNGEIRFSASHVSGSYWYINGMVLKEYT
jgi:hypothetical protein